MSIVVFDGPPSWSLDANETGGFNTTHRHFVLWLRLQQETEKLSDRHLKEKQGTVKSLILDKIGLSI